MSRRYVEERNIDTIEDLIKVYSEVRDKMGYFIMMGVPIPDDQRINFRSMFWINSVIQQPNVVIEYKLSRFCSEAYHRFTKTFLEKFTFATHLFLMDADEIPARTDVLQLMVAADKDVVVGPTPIIKSNKGICWNVNEYIEYPEPCEIDFIRWTELPNELFRVNFSGGPWLIKRKVLEKLEYPYFKDVFVEEGRKLGQDIYFDISVDEAGFEIWCEPKAKFEHYRPSNLNVAMDEYLKPDTGGLNYGGWAISEVDWDFIKKIIDENKAKTILEFGSGLSSLLMSDLATVDSFETDTEHARIIKQKGRKKNLNIHMWDGQICKLPQEKYDLVFVDGPVGKDKGGTGREFSIEIASLCSDKIIIHDAFRQDEQLWQDTHIKPYFNLVEQSKNCNYWKRKDK